MVQSQVKPSHCCRQTPWLAQDSSVQVVLGPRESRKEKCPRLSHMPGGCKSSTARQRGSALGPPDYKGQIMTRVMGQDRNRGEGAPQNY